MSELPTNWQMADGDDLFASVRGVTYSKADAVSTPSDGLVPILRANNIADGRIVVDDLVYVPGKYVSPEQYLRAGDLLIATSSGSRTVVGKAAAASDEHIRYAFGAFCTVARPRVQGFGDWLSRFARTRAYRDYVEQVALGISINNLRGSDLKSMPILLAPLPEQRRIVAKIDSLTGKSRRAREHLDHIPRLVEKYKQAVLAAAFRGDLTREWSEESRPAYDDHGIDGRLTNLSILPAGWSWTSMGAVVQITGGLTKNSARNALPLRVPYLRVANVYANELRLDEITEIGCTEAEYRRTLLQPGDLLIVEGNGSLDQIGRVAMWDGEHPGCAHQNHLIRARMGDNLMPSYTLYWLLSPQGRNAIETVASSSSGLHTLSISKVRGLPVPICSKEQQKAVVQRIQSAFIWIDR
ncbi:hypothetical protein C9R18_25320, partial [Salmonella enterica subsp. enterica serovar Enteritidis]|nr:hypothetical protein [Salmonella enterica subsp. enterica serovar Enteritidis]